MIVVDPGMVASREALLVALAAQGPGALEDLGGIRDKARLRQPQRVTLSSWAFAQLGSFIRYKALRRSAGGLRRPGLDLTHVRGLRSRRPAKPRLASTVHLPGLRRRCAR